MDVLSWSRMARQHRPGRAGNVPRGYRGEGESSTPSPRRDPASPNREQKCQQWRADLFDVTQPVLAERLADLPEGRRRYLLSERSNRGLEWLSRLAVSEVKFRLCDLWPLEACNLPVGARLASDGYYHLLGDSKLHDCAPVADVGASFVHEYDRFWWEAAEKNGVAPRVDPPRTNEHSSFKRTIVWGEHAMTDPALVRPRQRCRGAAEHWPGYTGSGERNNLAQTRRWLVRRFGAMCVACGLRRANNVDHDHETGMVRGYVCDHCNVMMDLCLHLSGCPWAAYLNAPPALALKLTYPGRTATPLLHGLDDLAVREAAADALLAQLRARVLI